MTTTPHPAPLTWHQAAAMRRAWKHRNKPAHIMCPDYSATLCGLPRHSAPVTIDAEHRHNPENKPCQHCRRIADA